MKTLCRHCGKDIQWFESYHEWLAYRQNNDLSANFCAFNGAGHDPVRNEGAKR